MRKLQLVTELFAVLFACFALLVACSDNNTPVQQRQVAPPVQAQQGCWDPNQPCQQGPNVVVVQQPQQNNMIDPMTAGVLGYMLGRSATSPNNTTTVVRERTVNVPTTAPGQYSSSTTTVSPAPAAQQPTQIAPQRPVTASQFSAQTNSTSKVTPPSTPTASTMSRGTTSSSSSSSTSKSTSSSSSNFSRR